MISGALQVQQLYFEFQAWINLLGCHNKIPQTGGLNQQKLIFSQLSHTFGSWWRSTSWLMDGCLVSLFLSPSPSSRRSSWTLNALGSTSQVLELQICTTQCSLAFLLYASPSRSGPCPHYFSKSSVISTVKLAVRACFVCSILETCFDYRGTSLRHPWKLCNLSLRRLLHHLLHLYRISGSSLAPTWEEPP